MKEHFCPAEKSIITYQDKCNWCGEREALAQTQESEYAWPTVADYERDVGFQTNEAFRMAWGMARTTNKMLGHPSPPQRTWVGLTDEERIEIDHLALSRVQAVQMTEAKLKELNT